MRASLLPLERLESERFWPRVEKDPATGCWNWTGSLTAGGYANMAYPKNNRWGNLYVHRWSYEHFVGPIPGGMQIDHLCRNRRCVNPDHLEAVTRRENNFRSNSWAGRNVRKTHCPQGHPYSEGNLLGMRKGRKCRICHADRERRAYQSRRVLTVVQQPEFTFGFDVAA